ncbi:poly(U)-specific endoribonuclease homolog [Copidosoma floridanum]|uniref:poly(U)-specific endoribonuclease homolog n=1 Tax=Copidosoma floridanum TaxID=29053 RepID=UPI0006C9A4DC|nr:poly(U)-specific endoribonuclease homolog [Copidosoma floridanum]
MARRTILAGVFVFALLATVLVEDIDARKTSGGSRKSGSSWGWGSRSTPKTQQHQHGTGSIGWSNPSNQKPASYPSSNPKPSAPGSEHISKSSATNVHSSYPQGNPPPYSPSGGYHGGNPPPYSPAGGYHGGNPPPYSSGGYGHPPPYSSGGYGGYGGYQPAGGYGGHSFSSMPGQGYNPSYGHSSMGSQPQTVILQSQKPGIGQLAKEAFVFAGVSAGVNAAVNRILPGGIYGNSHSSSSGVVPPVSHTQITYNNYYNNGTSGDSPAAAAPAATVPVAAAMTPNAAPAPAAEAPAPTNAAPQPLQPNATTEPPPPFGIPDSELQKVTENLFGKDANNAFKHITINVQGQKTDDSTTDDASENLLEVKPEAWDIPTVKSVLALHDNYEFDVRTKETVTSEERKEEADLIDAFMETDVMKETMKYLAEKGFVPNDEYEFKDTLKRIWFSQFKRVDGEPSSSGFETVFLAEKFDSEVIGLHDWIYFAKQEEAKKLNYLGYIKKLDLGSNGAVIKGRSSLNGNVQPITTIFVGTSPELEMALYTLCFYTRPGIVCPVSLGNGKVIIVVNRVNYFGKDILISAFPDI